MSNISRREALVRISAAAAALGSIPGCDDSPTGSAPRNSRDSEAATLDADAETVARKLAPWFERHKRLAWRPQVTSGDGPITESKFAGVPWLNKDENWPACPGCRRRFQLFLQIDLSRLPGNLSTQFGNGLLQLFLCTTDYPNCKVERDNWQPFADNELVRIIDPPFGTGTPHAPIPGHFPAKQITDWTPFDDYPEFMEHEELGLEWQFDFSKRQDATVQFECRDLQLPAISLPADVAERIADRCHDGDKLAGWPDWYQGVEYPKCPECGSRMENVIFQLDSEKHLPYMFGDVGRGHVTQCPNHKHVVTFNWACS